MVKKFILIFVIVFLGLINLNFVSAATNVSVCGLINESGIYELNKSIEIGASNICVFINVSDVVLDCLNYSNSIIGNGSDNTIGVGAFDNVASQTLTNVTVKNCNITKFDLGISLNNTNNSLVFNNSVYNSSTGIDLENTLDVNVSTNNITTFDYNSSAIFLMDDNSSVVESNIVTTNNTLANGIVICSSVDTLANLNTITILNNNASGITLEDGSTNINITTNTITTSNIGSMGIQLFDSSGSSLLFNNVINTSGNDSFGIYLEKANDMNISSNNITTSGYHGDGIHFQASNDSVITKNRVKTQTLAECVIQVEMLANNNTFYDNIFNSSNTSVPGFCLTDTAQLNNWNTSKAEATNIIGNSWIGGNYWTNYENTGYSNICLDEDGDYICDDAYNLIGTGSSNIDYLPLADHINMVSACDTLNITNKYYSLNQSLSVNGTCFNITANNITLNFNSFTITGNTTGYGVYVSSINATIVNGIISNFSNGLYLYNSSNNAISSIIINNSVQDAIFLNDPASENNNFTNITTINTNSSYVDIKLGNAGQNGTWLIDFSNFARYNFSGAGSLINFKEPTFGEIRFLEAINGSGANLGSDVDIEIKWAFVNSSSNSGLNKSANISFYSITYTDPMPQYSLDDNIWVNCTSSTSPACTEFPYTKGGTFTFNTTHFTYFKIIEVYSAEAEEEEVARGGGSTTGIITHTIDTISEGKSISKNLRVDDLIEFEIENIEHTLKITSIYNDSVDIEISSTPIKTTLNLDEKKKFDLDDDNIYDLAIALTKISGEWATLKLEGIKEAIPEEELPEEEIEEAPEEEEEEVEEVAKELWKKWWFWTIIVIVIIIALFLLLRGRENIAKKKKI